MTQLSPSHTRFQALFCRPLNSEAFTSLTRMPSDNLDGWESQDFIDQPTPIPLESDPWDPIPVLSESPSPTVDKLSGRPTETRQDTAGPATDVADPRMPRSDQHPVSSTSEPSPAGDLDIPTDWFEDEPETDQESEASDLPVPSFEYDPNLGVELYQGAEFIDLTDVEVRLDLFLASVGLSADQDCRIRGHLNGFSRARLSNWLPWLISKTWSARTLLMFVQFHNFWESMPEWWESRWYFRVSGWQPAKFPMSNILTRDNAYRIVHHRIDFHPEEMIDPVWFEEWDYHSLWRHGFLSFASFATFRSALNDGEEWKTLIFWESPEKDMESYSRRDLLIDSTLRLANGGPPTKEDEIPPYSYTSSLPRWYHIQDWYPEHEWHDNLGWNIPSVGASESSNSPESSPGPVWPFGGRNE